MSGSSDVVAAWIRVAFALNQAQRFQDSWATSFPWAKKVLNKNDLVVLVRCLICTRIEGGSQQ